MSTTARTTLRTLSVAARAVAVSTVILGLAYPAFILGVGQLALPAQANGSLLTPAGQDQPVGSTLIGQDFSDGDGGPLPGYVQGRPSAAGDGYDAAASSGSNLGPENPALVTQITERRNSLAQANGVPPEDIPADAVTASSSGLDPHISPAFANAQAKRVAAERALPVTRVTDLIQAHTSAADLGFLGEARVNVLELNAALDALAPMRG